MAVCKPAIESTELVSLIGVLGWAGSLTVSHLVSPDTAYLVLLRTAPIAVWAVTAYALAIAEVMALLLAYRRERWAWWARRAILLAAVGWWLFVLWTFVTVDPLWPSIGVYLACAYAAGWAFYRTLQHGR